MEGVPSAEMEVVSTGGWDRFEVRSALIIPPGTSGVRRVRMINDKAEGPLMKLRSVKVRPHSR